MDHSMEKTLDALRHLSLCDAVNGFEGDFKSKYIDYLVRNHNHSDALAWLSAENAWLNYVKLGLVRAFREKVISRADAEAMAFAFNLNSEGVMPHEVDEDEDEDEVAI